MSLDPSKDCLSICSTDHDCHQTSDCDADDECDTDRCLSYRPTNARQRSSRRQFFEPAINALDHHTKSFQTECSNFRCLQDLLETLKGKLEISVGQLVRGFDRVGHSISEHEHISTTCEAINECGRVCHEVEQIMLHISDLKYNAQKSYEQCLRSYDYISSTASLTEKLERQMIKINRVIHDIRRDCERSVVLGNFMDPR